MGGVVGRRRHGCPRGHPIRPQLGASTAPTEESTLETRRGCGALRPDRLGVPDGDWNRSAVHVPRDPVAGLGGLAVPATGGCTGRPARRAHRLMGGRQGRRAVRSWNAAREDAHAPGVQRDGRLLLVLLRRLGDGAEQAHQALERAAVELDARVRQRTSQLYATNLYLRNEVAEREESEQKLRQQEAQLAEAQQVAHIGSWEWMIPQNRVSWSDEMYRIHGHIPQAFPAAFEMAVAQVNTEDAARIRSNVEEALRRADDHDLPNIEYRITRDDGVERVLLGKAKVCVGPNREPLRMFGTVQDVTEGRKAEREHRIAETLQRSLLPDRLPELPGVLLAARYVPASADMEVGGDWYDVVQLPNGQVGLAIGDVAGHGLRAASTMGQLRMGLRAYALEEPSPAKVVSRLDRLVSQLLESEIVTLVYLILDLDSGMVQLANAGHPPPLVVGPEGQTSYLEDGLGSPLGCGDPEPVETSFRLVPGSTLLLFTDGLVEKRGVSIEEGLEHLEILAADCDQDIETFCEVILGSMVKGVISDDVALLAIRPLPLAGGLLLHVPAEPRVLAPLRQTLRRWLREIDAAPPVANDILIACGEVCANVIQHAYGAKEGLLEISLGLCDGTAEVTVRDQGCWRPSSGIHGSHGLPLIQELMESVEVDSGPDGTVVRMHRRLSNGNGSD